MKKRQFRVLYREFLFRMVDRELLSSHAEGDASKLLGQFAAVLVLMSVLFTIPLLGLNAHLPQKELLISAWEVEHALISMTMLIVGVFAVLSWESIFPDRRDVLVLAPLPVSARVIFLARLASLAAALSMTVAVFNAFPGLLFPLALAPAQANILEVLFSPRTYRVVFAFVFTIFGAGAFILCSVLTVQGLAAQLPRRYFLRISGILQIATLCTVMGGYFLEPSVTSLHRLIAMTSQAGLGWSPSYWFLGLFQELNGSVPKVGHSTLLGLATRAWLGLALSLGGAGTVFLLSYVRTVRRALEEPDLVPSRRRSDWLGHLQGFPGLRRSLDAAVLQFTARTLLRSRQHRVILSFYAGIGFAVAILFLKTSLARQLAAASGNSWHQPTLALIASSIVLLCFWILGVRVVLALPMELRANWMFRITCLRDTAEYFTAARRAFFAVALLPVWTVAALVFVDLWPWRPALEHLAVLVLLGFTVAQACAYNLRKVPFTCSYLPGKSNLHVTFWLCLMLGLNIVYRGAEFERQALTGSANAGWMWAVLGAAGVTAWWRTNAGARSPDAVLQFDEEREPVVMSLGLRWDGGTDEASVVKAPERAS